MKVFTLTHVFDIFGIPWVTVLEDDGDTHTLHIQTLEGFIASMKEYAAGKRDEKDVS